MQIEKPVVPEPEKTDPSQELASLKEQLLKLTQERDNFLKKDQTLNDKVKMEQEERSKRDGDSKTLESALTFNLTSAEFLKNNEAILPKDVSDILKIANQEKYESAIHKANATKAAIIQSFFSQQSNADLLTPTQQTTLADYLKLTKNGKEDKAQLIYDNLFEPAIGSLKRVKKAEELYRSKQGFSSTTDTDQAYKEKMIKLAERKFFRGKH